MSTLLQQRHPPITAPKLRDRGPAQPPTPGLQLAIPGSQVAIPGLQLAMPRASARHAVPAHPVVAPRASWSLMLGLIVATLREWRRRHVARYELASLDGGRCATSASIPASSTTRCASRSGGPLAIGEIDRRRGEPNAFAIAISGSAFE
jgi:hypothetical protein